MKEEFSWIGILLLALWLVLIVDATIPADLAAFGLKPRRLSGLPGILTMPFLHGGFGHLLGNTFSLIVLLGLMVGSQRAPWVAVALISVAGGALLWVVGRDANHVGASGLVCGLIGYLVLTGFFDRRLVSIGVAVLVGLLFGTTLLWGIIPISEGVSWDGHLCGLLGGLAVAFLNHRRIAK